MKIVIRMLKIATIILWVIVIFFSVTAVYSVTQMGVSTGEPEILPSVTGVRFSLPFSINNGGYYEIADLNLTTRVTDQQGTLLDETETFVPSIPPETNITANHEILIGLNDILSLNQTSLLLEDSDFNVEIFAGLNFAHAVPVQLSLNTSIPWGAPFANFELQDITISDYNGTHVQAIIAIRFENHAILDIYGTLSIEAYNNSGQRIGSGTTEINASSGYGIYADIPIYVQQQNVPSLTASGRFHVTFQTVIFIVEWDEYYG
jgi:hypothetical protein